MLLIPAIDLRHGQVVRLAQGDDERRKAYDVSPGEMLDLYAEAGIELAHVIDLDAAFGETPQRDLIAELAGRRRPKIELGGGLRDHASIEWALGTGCERVILGSMVAKDFPQFAALARAFPNRLVPALEVGTNPETGRHELRISGWREAAKPSLDEIGTVLRGLPCPAVLVTDIDRDGTLQGPNLDLARQVAILTGFPALLSGGVHALSDLEQAARIPEIGGAIVGKAIYEGVFSVEEALEAIGGAS